MFKVGMYVHCPAGLGIIRKIENDVAIVFIHTFGQRQYKLTSLTIAYM